MTNPQLLTGQKLEELSIYFHWIMQTSEGRKLLREYKVNSLSLTHYFLEKMRSIEDNPSQELNPNRVVQHEFMVHLVQIIHAYLLDDIIPSSDELDITAADLLDPSFRHLLFFPSTEESEKLGNFLKSYRNGEGKNFAQLTLLSEKAYAELRKAVKDDAAFTAMLPNYCDPCPNLGRKRRN